MYSKSEIVSRFSKLKPSEIFEKKNVSNGTFTPFVLIHGGTRVHIDFLLPIFLCLFHLIGIELNIYSAAALFGDSHWLEKNSPKRF